MRKYQILIGFIILSIAIIVGSCILSAAIKDMAIRLVRVIQLQ